MGLMLFKKNKLFIMIVVLLSMDQFVVTKENVNAWTHMNYDEIELSLLSQTRPRFASRIEYIAIYVDSKVK